MEEKGPDFDAAGPRVVSVGKGLGVATRSA